MRGRGRGRGSAGQTPLPGMSDMGETGEVVEDKSPPPDYPVFFY